MPITLGLVHCLQLILKLIEVIRGNCLNAINNASACSVLLLSTLVLFPTFRETLEHSTTSCALKFFCLLETTVSYSETVLSTLNHCLLRYSITDHQIVFQKQYHNADFQNKIPRHKRNVHLESNKSIKYFLSGTKDSTYQIYLCGHEMIF